MATIEVSDFHFCNLKKIRICPEFAGSPTDQKSQLRNYVSSSSQFGITAVYCSENKLLSFSTADVFNLQSSKSDVNAESYLTTVKSTSLPAEGNVVSIGSNANGRVLSVLMGTENGAFVYFYDFCALSPKQKDEVGSIQSIRLSTSNSISAVEFQWNPTVESSFAVLTSDGVLSTYMFDFNDPKKFSILGTVQLKVPGSCICWSPKGKQLVVGDVQGKIHQFKPEMTLVRTVPPPPNESSKDNNSLLCCVGLCWLSTTEFFVAYSMANEQNLCISLLTAKKEGLPHWTHYNNVIYCAKQCPYLQRIHFVPLFQWNIVLCASSRSSEVGVLGKHDGVWKMWSLNDNSRIELPLSHSQDDSFPFGICFDTSSEVPFKTGGDDNDNSNGLICPCTFILTSSGLLLSYNVVSFNSSHSVINRAPNPLPLSVNLGVLTLKNAATSKTTNIISSPNGQIATATSATSQQITKAPINVFSQPVTTAKQPSIFAKSLFTSTCSPSTTTTFSQSSVSTFGSTVNSTFSNKGSAFQRITTAASSCTSGHSMMEAAKISPASNAVMSASGLPVVASASSVKDISREKKEQEELVELRTELKNKLIIFEQKYGDAKEANEWMKDLVNTLEKNIVLQCEKPYEFNDEELEEVRKLGCETEVWLKKVKSEVAELKVAFDEQKKTVELAEKENVQPVSMTVLDFNNRYRLSKLKESFRSVERKLAMAEDGFSGISDGPSFDLSPSSSERYMSPEEERKLCTAVKSICKAIIVRRKQLSDLYHEFSDLEAKLRLFAKRAPFALRPRKLENISQSKTTMDVRTLKTDIGDLESRLIDAIASSHKKVHKKLMDVGIQSPSSMDKEAKKEDAVGLSGLTSRQDGHTPVQALSFSDLRGTGNTENTNLSSEVGINKPTFSFMAAVDNAKPFQANSSIPVSHQDTLSVPAASTPSVASVTTSAFSSSGFSFTPAAVPASSSSPIRPFADSSKKSILLTAAAPKSSAKENSTSKDLEKGDVKEVMNESSTGTVPTPGFDGTSGEKSSENEKPVSDSASQSAAPSTVSPAIPVSSVGNTAGDGSSTVATKTTVATTAAESKTVNAPDGKSTNASKAEAGDTKPAKVVTFSFATPVTTPAAPPPTGSSLFSTTAPSTSAPASHSDMDEGMDEETTTNATSSLFSSAFSGLGSSTTANMNSSKSIFGGSRGFGGNTTNMASSSLFGGGLNKAKSGSVFGGASAASTGTLFSSSTSSLFGSGSSNTAAATATSSLFSSKIAQSQQQQQQSSSLFGSKPSVSSTSTFGGAPTFGSKPTFSSSSPFTSGLFQNRPAQAPTSTPSTFSGFSRGGAFTFGSLASGQQLAGNSVFGGSSFSSLGTQNTAKSSSVFGGGVNTSSSSSFSTWR